MTQCVIMSELCVFDVDDHVDALIWNNSAAAINRALWDEHVSTNFSLIWSIDEAKSSSISKVLLVVLEIWSSYMLVL